MAIIVTEGGVGRHDPKSPASTTTKLAVSLQRCHNHAEHAAIHFFVGSPNFHVNCHVFGLDDSPSFGRIAGKRPMNAAINPYQATSSGNDSSSRLRSERPGDFSFCAAITKDLVATPADWQQLQDRFA